eukprot:TRINITY_DN8367_c0_g1_i1.p1 TRINITY_DN8367_c0_g1~~TRINITY_DN8367_c0_g1_i1.p1  ORF type:complete len:374 (+),score=72.33 TRINITY_DN8367_c0_g1_i1:247-1368(+)
MGNVTSNRRRQDRNRNWHHQRAASASYIVAANGPYQMPYPPQPDPYQSIYQPPPPQMYYSPYPPPPPPPPARGPWQYGVRPAHPPTNSWTNGAPTVISHSPSITVPTPPPPPYVEHQKTTTIRNDVNLRKETLHLERDEKHPDRVLVAFSLDSMVAGSISIFFFAKEGANCSLTAMKPNIFQPLKIPFGKGLGQKFCQPSGSGIDLSFFEESELTNVGEDEVFPLVIRADATSTQLANDTPNEKCIGDPLPKSVNSQITQAVFEKKENGEYRAKVVKQILWVDGVRYELQEIYGIGSSAGSEFDSNDPGKECVICMSEPRDTAVLPCRHMCMCSECAKLLRLQTNRCPICRRPVERLMEIKFHKNEKFEDQPY